MSGIKFHHVFAALLALSALSAFVIPARYTTKAQPQIQALFQPVAKPVRSVAGWMSERLFTPPQRDARDKHAIVDENEELKQEVARLAHALKEFQRQEEVWAKFRGTRELCTLLQVVGQAPGGRESLLLRGSTFEGIREGQPVLYAGGILGRIEPAPGVLGAQVRLITDPGMRMEGYFAGYDGTQLVRRDTSAALFDGVGQGALRCRGMIKKSEVNGEKGVRLGDGLFLQDRDWDERLHGFRLGTVVRIDDQPDAPLYVDIRVEPSAKLLRVRDVMVMTK